MLALGTSSGGHKYSWESPSSTDKIKTNKVYSSVIVLSLLLYNFRAHSTLSTNNSLLQKAAFLTPLRGEARGCLCR